MTKIVDAFIFYNELEMLEFRLAELNDFVDHFVLVESDKTFAGTLKPLFFNENKNRYEKYLPKIIHVIVHDMPVSGNAWGREYHQRNAIDRGIRELQLTNDDIIILSDVDEIPDTNVLFQQRTNPVKKAMILSQDMFYYNLECKARLQWLWVKIMPYSVYKTVSPQKHRDARYPKIEKGGWHFSYFGSEDFIINKIQQFSHQEFNNPKYTNKDIIRNRIENCSDLFGRPGKGGPHGFYHHPVENNSYLPKNYQMLLS